MLSAPVQDYINLFRCRSQFLFIYIYTISSATQLTLILFNWRQKDISVGNFYKLCMAIKRKWDKMSAFDHYNFSDYNLKLFPHSTKNHLNSCYPYEALWQARTPLVGPIKCVSLETKRNSCSILWYNNFVFNPADTTLKEIDKICVLVKIFLLSSIGYEPGGQWPFHIFMSFWSTP